MKLAHIRYTLTTALDEFKNGTAPATHILSAIEALIEEKHAPTATQQTQDIPDLIAGMLGVSRGTAYDLMREALSGQDDPGLKNTSPPASKPWVGLTDEERVEVLFQNPHLTVGGLLAVEAKLKEKND